MLFIYHSRTLTSIIYHVRPFLAIVGHLLAILGHFRAIFGLSWAILPIFSSFCVISGILSYFKQIVVDLSIILGDSSLL